MLEGGLRRFSFGTCNGYIYSQRQFNLVGSPYDEVVDSWKRGVELRVEFE